MKDYYSVTADDFNFLHGFFNKLSEQGNDLSDPEVKAKFINTFCSFGVFDDPKVVEEILQYKTYQEFKESLTIKVKGPAFESFIQEIRTLEAKVDNLWVMQSAIDSKLSELLLAQQGNNEESSQETGKKKKYKVRNGFKEWTPEEEQFILDHPKWSNKSIAGRLHRTPTAIYVRKWRMVKEGRLPAES